MKRLLVSGILMLMSAQSEAATVPFDDSTGRPIIQLMVNGKGPYPFVLDTGSPILLVRQALIDELGLPVVGKTVLNSPLKGTPVESVRVHIDAIGLGEMSVEGLEASSIDIGGSAIGMGVVGPSIFRQLGRFSINFKDRVILIGEVPAPGAIKTWLPFGKSAPLLDVPVQIGDLRIDGHIDTGSPGGLSLPSRFADQVPLLGPIRTVGTAGTLDAEFEIRAAPFGGSIQLGDATVPIDEIKFADLPVANVGTATLRGLSLYIDWEGERFALVGSAPRMVRDAAGDTRPRFGVRGTPATDGTLRVAGTDPGSPAEAIGLVAGDIIVGINGQPITDFSPGQLREQFSRPDLELVVRRNGSAITLKNEE